MNRDPLTGETGDLHRDVVGELHLGGPFAMCAVIAGTQIASTLVILAFGPFGAPHAGEQS